MRGYAVPKVYRSFEEFERDELRKLDGIHLSIDEMLDDMFPPESQQPESQQSTASTDTIDTTPDTIAAPIKKVA